ncbi:MAG: outer membrane beta-barrel protein [Caulobacteraceae bacterium]|nr:outer membrane beta-barrel protein [Caulobacteraceae bacterium]
MKFRMTTFLATTAAAALAAGGALAQTTAAPAAAPPPAPTATPYPAMSASLAGAAPPMTYDLGILGSKVAIGGVLSGLAQVQTHHVLGDDKTLVDLSNAQIFINKSDGWFQYYIQAGTYSLPALGSAAYRFSTRNNNNGLNAPSANFGNLPTAFAKLVPPSGPLSAFSLEVGLLPTLIGDEYVFTFENLNITRGLLWGAEPAISRGVQLNYSAGPLSASVAWTDGFYSNRYNTISGLATLTINSSNTLAVDASIPVSKSTTYQGTNATSTAFDNSKVFNIMYTHTMGQWIINPYLQYTALPEVINGGVLYNGKEETWGAALLVNYAFDSKATFDGVSLSGLSLPFRIEYMHTNGSPNSSPPSPNLLYGAGSKAWSFTVTPTYQYKNYFVRAEANYVTATDVDTTHGAGYGIFGTKKDQLRGLIETGVLF